MKTCKTAKDVIDQTKAFHKRLGDFYMELSDKAERERVKILLEYMSRHQDNLVSVVQEYEDSVSEHILNTWFMYVSDECDLSAYFDANLGPDMTAQQVIQVAMELDKCLLETYQAMMEKEVPDEVQEVFARFLKMEEEQKILMAKNALYIEDL